MSQYELKSFSQVEVLVPSYSAVNEDSKSEVLKRYICENNSV